MAPKPVQRSRGVPSKTRQVYRTIKTLTGKQTLRMKSIKDTDGNVLTEEEKIKNRWKENFADLYNMPGPSDTSIIQTIPSTQTEDTEPDILKEEVATALKHLKEGKAAGFDGISAEEMKATGEIGIDVIHKLCRRIWDTEEIPDDWGKAVIVPIFKKEGQNRLC